MSDKREIYNDIKRLKVIKTWQLLILLVLSLFLSATLLRLNNTGMVARLNAIEGADKSGDTNALVNLVTQMQQYTAGHMNASTGVFYLQQTYDNDVRSAMAAADGSATTDANSPQAKADTICNPDLQIHGYSKEYQDCMMQQLDKAGQVVDPATIKLPNPILYRYNFVSPAWSPDAAGFSVLVPCVLVLMIVGRLVTIGVFRLLLKLRYRQL